MPNLAAAMADLKSTGRYRFNEMPPAAKAFREQVLAAMGCNEADIELRQTRPNWNYLLIDHRHPKAPAIGRN